MSDTENFLSPEIWSWRREIANLPGEWQDRPSVDPHMSRPAEVASQWVPDRLSQRLPIAFDNVLSRLSGGNSRFNTEMAHKLSNYLRFASPVGPATEALDAAHRAGGMAIDGRLGDAAVDLGRSVVDYGGARYGIQFNALAPFSYPRDTK